MADVLDQADVDADNIGVESQEEEAVEGRVNRVYQFVFRAFCNKVDRHK